MSFAPTARAQPSDPQTESVKAEGRRRFQAGQQALARGDYERAYLEFRSAYAMVPSRNTLGNLAHAEIKTKRYVDGARHLQEFGPPEALPPHLRALHDEALSQVGRLQIEISEPGASVYIDEQLVKLTTPAALDFIGEPGEHALRIEKAGRAPVNRTVTLAKGEVVRERIALEAEPGAISSTPSNVAPAAPSVPSVPPPAFDRPEPTPGGGATKTIVVGAGIGLTAVGIGVTTVFALKGAAASDRIDDERAELRARLGPGACANDSTPCGALYSAYSDRREANDAANVALGVTAALAVGTAAAYFFWPSGARAPSSGWKPWLGTNVAGAVWEGALP